MVIKGLGADLRSSLFVRIVMLFALLVLFAGVCSAATAEPVTCDPKTGIWDFGQEWVADTCVPRTMSDNTSVHYLNNYITCNRDSNTVALFSSYGDDTMTPGNFISYALGATNSHGRHYKIFRNKEGTHFLLIDPEYTGEIDGEDMTDYIEGQVYTDVFDRGFILPTTPDCQGGDFNDPNDQNDPNPNGPNNPNGSNPSNPNGPGNPGTPTDPDSPFPCTSGCSCGPPPTEEHGGSTVNLGTGRLSHSQQLFSVNTGSPLDFSIYLFYRSLPFAPSSIGNGWSHSYEMVLQASANNSITFWYNGKQRLYTLHDGSFSPPKGDNSTLTKNGDGTFLLTETNGLRRYFDANGLVSSVVDRFDNALIFAYSGAELSSVRDQNGRTVNFTYKNGKLDNILDPNNAVYGLSYASATLAKLTLPGGDQWNYTYNISNNLLETKTDPKQQNTTYTYTGNAVTSVADPAGKGQGYSYAPPVSPGKIPDPYPHALLLPKQFAYADKNGNQWGKTYDTLTEKVSSVTDPLGNVTSYTFDGQGNMLSLTKPPVNGIRYATFFGYDPLGNLIAKTEPTDIASLGIVQAP